jgi:hypothetical protein
LHIKNTILIVWGSIQEKKFTLKKFNIAGILVSGVTIWIVPYLIAVQYESLFILQLTVPFIYFTYNIVYSSKGENREIK